MDAVFIGKSHQIIDEMSLEQNSVRLTYDKQYNNRYLLFF